jgi:hypothetical protein
MTVAPKTERHPKTGRFRPVTPLTVARLTTKPQQDARERYLAGRRRDAAKRGYRGPLTRAEASQRVLSQF